MVNVYVYRPDFIADIPFLSSGAQVIHAPSLCSFQPPGCYYVMNIFPSRSSKDVDCL